MLNVENFLGNLNKKVTVSLNCTFQLVLFCIAFHCIALCMKHCCIIWGTVMFSVFYCLSPRYVYFKGISIRVKKNVAEQEMERRRYLEEIDVVRREMGNYIEYYKQKLIPKMELQLVNLTSECSTEGERSYIQIVHVNILYYSVYTA